MKIRRYQTGGIYYTPFSRDSAIQQGSQPSTSTSSSDNKEEQLIQKEIINVLKENGLPNDVDYFLSKADTFLRKSQNLGQLFSTDTNTSYDMSDLIRLQSLANRIKHNNTLHEQASKQIISEGSGSEAAITNTGNLYVIDEEEGVKTIDLNTYHKNPNKYNILTNSELIRLREEQPELAYNGTILTDLSNTVGMKSIVDYVKSTIGSFGTNKSSNQLDRYTSKQKNQIEKGFEQLLGFDTPDGIYKVTESTSESNQGYSDAKSLDAAINYLYRTLPSNMKNVLRANAAAEGLNPNDPKDVQNLLAMAIVEHTDHTQEYKQSLSYDSSVNKSSDGGSSGSDKTVKQSYLEMVATGEVTTPDKVIIASSNTTGGLESVAQPYGYPLDESGKQVGRGTLRDVLQKSQIGQLIDKNSISFGNKRLTDNELDRVVYDGISTLNRVWLPIDQNAEANLGIIRPDLDMERRFNEFQEWLNEGYGITPNSITLKMNELNLDIVYDQKQQCWRPRVERPFLVFNGYASDKAVNLDENSDWISHVDKSEGSRIFDIYSKYINYGSDTASKSSKRDSFSGGWFGIGDAGSMYKSAIFMPITDAGIATVVSNHQLVTERNYIDILNRRKQLMESQRIPTNF